MENIKRRITSIEPMIARIARIFFVPFLNNVTTPST